MTKLHSGGGIATDAAQARRLLTHHAAIGRLALADISVDELLEQVSGQVAAALGSSRAGFFDVDREALQLRAGVGWRPDAAELAARVPSGVLPIQPIRGVSSLRQELARRYPSDEAGLVASASAPDGRPVVFVTSCESELETDPATIEFVGFAVDLVSAGWSHRHLERELRDSERRMVEAQELAHMGSYDWNILTDTNLWSDELYRIYGYEPQTFNASYDRFLSLLHPDDRDAIVAVHQRAYASLEPYEMTERIVRPDGSIRTLASNGEVIADDQGRPVRMRGTCVDITDRLRVEAEARKIDTAEQRRRQALEINDNVIQGLASALWTLDSGAVETTREVVARTLEAARSMMTGLLDSDSPIAAGDLVRSAPPDRQIIDHVPSDLVPVDPPTDVRARPRVVIADDAEDIRLLLRVQLTSQLAADVVMEVATGRDAVLAATEHQPDVILLDVAMPGGDGLSAIPGIRAASPRTKIIMLSGFAAGELAEAALQAGADAYIEKGAFASVIEALERELPGRFAPPSPDAHVGYDPDASAAPDKTDFDLVLGQLVHELRTPATVITGLADVLSDRRETIPSAASDELYGALKRNVAILAGLLDSVASGVRISRESLQRSSVDLRGLVDRTARDLAPLLGDVGVRVEVSGAATHVVVDELRIRQVLTNLLTNAAKFSPSGMPVEIVVSSADGRATVSIRDHGPGVDHEVRSRIFQPFVRDPGSAGGLGVGLYISRAIAVAHGGELRLADVDDGACFVLSVPVSPA